MAKNRSKAVVLSLGLVCNLVFSLSLYAPANASGKLNRNQIMLLNLKTAPESSGYYLVTSYRQSKEILDNLDHALNQLEAVDKSYAKYRHRPDNSFLQSARLKTTLARQTARELQQQLQDAYAELKSSIEEALITEEHFPSDKKPEKNKQSVPNKVKNFLL